MKSKKGVLIISLTLITVLIGLVLYLFVFVDIENEPRYYINLGDTFTIKLSANPSTGYRNYWINEDKSDKVKLINEQYKSSLNQKLGYDGAGGTLLWTFKGVKPGIDTIKIAFCSTGDCNDFKADSIEPDYQFIVNIANR